MSNAFPNIDSSSAADAAAGVLLSLPFRRERDATWGEEPAMKKAKYFTSDAPTTCLPQMPSKMTAKSSKVPLSTSSVPSTPSNTTVRSSVDEIPVTTGRRIRDPVLKRQTRLEQNRRAAKESRQRKNKMIEELQRSVIFFSRANSTLKQQNEEVTRLIKKALDCIPVEKRDIGVDDASDIQKEEEPVLSMSIKKENEPESEERETAKLLTSLNASPLIQNDRKPAESTKPEAKVEQVETNPQSDNENVYQLSMQPGSTMQAMASFQQAASAAMQEAMKGLQNNMGLNFLQLAAVPPVLSVGATNAQQAYTDTMTSIAMQQAAAAAVAASAGQTQALMMSSLPFMMNPMMGPMFAWQLQQQHLQFLQQQQQQFQP